MIRRPPRSTLSSSSAASDVYKRQEHDTAEDESLFAREAESRLQVGHGPSHRGPAGFPRFLVGLDEEVKWFGQVTRRQQGRGRQGIRARERAAFAQVHAQRD